MVYYPVARTISGITNAQNAAITFTEEHGYLVGQVLGFRVGTEWGMFQINERHGQVTSITSTTEVVVDVDSTNWDSFVTPGSPTKADPMSVPAWSGFIEESGIVGSNINCAFDKRP